MVMDQILLEGWHGSCRPRRSLDTIVAFYVKAL